MSARRIRPRQVLVLAVAGLMAAVMLVLGIWQMSVYRNTGTRKLLERSQQPAVSLDAQLSSGTAVGSLYGTQVTLTGSYLSGVQLVGTAPPYRVVQAFRDGSRIIGVVRGTVPSLASRIPSAPSGSVTQTGILMPSESSQTVPSASASTIPTVNLEQLAQVWPQGVLAGFVTLGTSDASAQGLTAATVTMPDNASGRAQNLGYAMQWWVFAICTVAGGVVIARSMRRRETEATADHEGDDRPTPAVSSSSTDRD